MMSGMKNNVDTDKLTAILDGVRANPSLAAFTFRSETHWLCGAHSQTTIQQFVGGGKKDQTRSHPFIVESDEPIPLLGTDAAPNPVELVLAALASCLTVGISYNAAMRGIEIESLKITIEGDIDLQGFLNLNEHTRPGYRNIRIDCRIESDATREENKKLLDYVTTISPVFDMIKNPVPITYTHH